MRTSSSSRASAMSRLRISLPIRRRIRTTTRSRLAAAFSRTSPIFRSHMSQNNQLGNTIIMDSHGDTLTLSHTLMANLHANDFMLL